MAGARGATRVTQLVTQLAANGSGDLLVAVCSDRVMRLLRLDASAAGEAGAQQASAVAACAVLAQTQACALPLIPPFSTP